MGDFKLKDEKKEVKAELDKNFEKEIFERDEKDKNIKRDKLEDKAGLEPAPKVKTDVQLEHLVDTARKHNLNLDLNRDKAEQLPADVERDQINPLAGRGPYELTPDQQKAVRRILHNSGADSASQIVAYNQLRDLLRNALEGV